MEQEIGKPIEISLHSFASSDRATDRIIRVSRTIDGKGIGSPVMINRYFGRNFGWQRIAALMLSCSSTTVWAQLPAQKLSPLNQIGRSWGFGISDGYHECPECKNCASPTGSGGRAASNNTHESPDCQKPSFFSRMNPYKDSSAEGTSATGGHGAGSGSMIVLPPSPQMYQQFAVPYEPAAPIANYQPTDPNPGYDQSLPVAPGPFLTSPGSQVPDPAESDSFESNPLRNDDQLLQEQDSVPPPPILRKRQKADKPLGEESVPAFPRVNVPAKPNDKVDDSLDLLPKEESPPITMRPQPQRGRSLIQKTPLAVDESWNIPSQTSNEWKVQQYYGNAYSQQPMPRQLEAYRTNTANRYR